ncbi:MAG: hypothetical protein Q8J89_12125 [Caulobacter sp.]|nr:hypothetical protein [Caulobacter sp.]
MTLIIVQRGFLVYGTDLMAGTCRYGARWGAGVWAMVALAVALRLTVLPGYMIQAAPGALTVVICTANGAVSQAVDVPGTSSAPHEQQDEGDGKAPVCAFAMAGATLAAPEGQIATAAPPSTAAPLLPPAGAAAPGRGLAAPPPPATGPPFSV